MNPPLVSVILSVYNGQRYLEKSIDSVLNQTFSDFEFLIYDAGSTDNTAKIVESKNDTRIKFWRSPDKQGLSLVLNKLIAQAQGKYIRLWCYDDIMKPHCLATEIKFYEHNPQLGFCYCNRDDIDEQDKLLPPAEKDETPAIVSPSLATQLMFYWGCLPGSISVLMIKKEILEKIGGLDHNLFPSNDFDLCVRISEKYPIGYIEEPLVLVRRHCAQLSKSSEITLAKIKENREIYARLLERMPPELVPYAKRYHRRYVYVQYFHCLIHNLLKGNLNTAAEILRELRKSDRVSVILWFWLCSFGCRRRLDPQPKIEEFSDF